MTRRLLTSFVALVIATGALWVVDGDPAEAAEVSSAFTDDNWSVHEADINGLAAAGITKGCNPPANTRFCPNDPVTRGEMAAFLARAFRLPAADPAPFTDIAGSVHRRSINAISAAGVTKGCNPPANTRYCPSEPVTRAQMASFLVRALPDVEPIPTRLLLRPGSWCTRDRTQCSASIAIPAGRSFRVREGWYQTLPYRGGEKSAFQGSDTRFDLSIDGVTVPMQMRMGSSSSQATRDWTYLVPGLSRGTHTLRGVWRWRGKQDLVVTVVVAAT